MSKGKLLAFVLVWLMLFGVGAVAWKFVFQPKIEEAKEQEHEQYLNIGSSESRYDHKLTLSLDAFSGYAILRSKEFHRELSSKSIKVNLLDDGADYTKRLANMQSGKSQMAVFTIDALLKASSQAGDLPASIVAIIDETRGADAIVGYKKKYPDVNSFNDPSMRFVLTPDSPSETLARVVMSHFELPSLGNSPFIAADGAAQVYDRCRKASPDEHQVYVLWEPFVSKALENPNLGIITSTRDMFGYIVDVLVVSRDYLASNEAVVRDVVESYFRAAYKHQSAMSELVLEDAKAQGEPLSSKQANRLANGVQWKGTQRNYAHFGIGNSHSALHVEDMIENITKVLISTSGIASDPTNGSPNLLYYNRILQQLADEDFHPAGVGGEGFDDSIQLKPLSDSEWSELTNVGTLKVERLVFRRSKATLATRSKGILDDLADKLRTQRYYLKICGVTTEAGDANMQLAKDRAQAALDYLVEHGIEAERMRSVEPQIGDAPSVTFTLGQLPY